MGEQVFDLVVVGSGIVGLAHATEAVRRGLKVAVIERDHRPVGASIRNFGHACVTAQAVEEQTGDLAALAMRSRSGWLAAARDAGFWAREAGCIVVARTAAEMGVLEEFQQHRGSDDVVLQSADQVRERIGPTSAADIVGGAFLPRDIRVDPRQAVYSLVDWLTRQGVVFHFATTACEIESGIVHTSRGAVRGERIVVCVNHDLDQLRPDVADQFQMRRCALQMVMVDAPAHWKLESAVLTGTSMLRYAAMAATSAADTVRAELSQKAPELLAMDANVMFTWRPDGTLLIGDSHVYDGTVDPFLDEDMTDRLLQEVGAVVGVNRWRVRQRWQGIYASSPMTSLVRTPLADGVLATSVTTGIGMTMSFGVAAAYFD